MRSHIGLEGNERGNPVQVILIIHVGLKQVECEPHDW